MVNDKINIKIPPLNIKKKDSLDNFFNSIKQLIDNQSYTKALKVLNDNFENLSKIAVFWEFKGIIHHNLGKHSEAVEYYEKAINLDSSLVNSNLNLAGIFYSKKNYNKSSIYFKSALLLRPENKTIWQQFAKSLLLLGSFDFAKLAAEKACSLEPLNDWESYSILGSALVSLSEYDKAEDILLKSTNFNPTAFDPLITLGKLYAYKGDFINSERFFRQVIQMDSFNAEAFSNLVKINKLNSNEKLVTDMIKLFNNKKLDNNSLSLIGFGLAKIFNTEKKYSISSDFLLQANDLFYNSIDKVLLDDYLILSNNITNIFSKKVININTLERNETFKPIFIVGLPRSGTTLVTQILSSHKNVSSCGELTVIPKIASTIKDSNMISETFLSKSIKKYIDATAIHNPNNTKFTVDKMPGNYFYIGLIKNMFKNSKIIHIKRKPLDNILSIFQQNFPVGNFYSYSLDDIYSVYNDYIKNITFWDKIYPNEIFHLSYEDLIRDRNFYINKLLQYCDLSIDDNCYNFHTNASPVHTSSFYESRQELYSSSVDKALNYMNILQDISDKLKNNS